MKKELKELVEELVSSNNEYTRSPYWMIIDPKQMFRLNAHYVASMFTGPFFSRKSATDFLNKTRYNFSSRAVVYCCSGTYSKLYDNFCSSIGKT